MFIIQYTTPDCKSYSVIFTKKCWASPSDLCKKRRAFALLFYVDSNYFTMFRVRLSVLASLLKSLSTTSLPSAISFSMAL